MTTLSAAALSTLPAPVERPRHDLKDVRTGIVHFGPGAFHRAHQAAYFDRLLDSDPRWGIAAVSLRSGTTTDALKRQGGLYTLAIVDREPAMRVIAAHSEAIGPGEGARLRELLADPAVRIVSSTVTEKGYCLAGDGTLDFGHADIARDLQGGAEPTSLVGWIVEGLAARHAAGTPPFAVLSCDNMANNGTKLRAAVIAFARRRDDALADWIAAEVAFPNSMVNAITPASDAGFLAHVRRDLGLDDAAAVQRDRASEWVIEPFTLADGPDLASVGVTITPDVAAWEQAKLRLLNGAHSTLAYVGLALGLDTVAEAMADPRLEHFVSGLMHVEIAESLRPSESLNAAAYADIILERFRNPAIRHLLSQIAWDGSQKLPYRLLDTIQDALDHGRSIDRLAVPIAAWIAFIRRKAQAHETIVDPLADTLARAATGSDVASAMLAIRQVFPERLAADPRFRHAVAEALVHFLEGDVATLLTR
jgi:fructuronate reductase